MPLPDSRNPDGTMTGDIRTGPAGASTARTTRRLGPPRAFRFAASVPSRLQPINEWKRKLSQLEDLGYSTAAIADHFTSGYTLEPLTALAAASMCTTTLRLQTHVLGNDYRQPVQVHRAAAMIDALSEGRLELGLGAGWMISDYEAAGIPYEPARVRVERWAESIEVIKGLFGSAPFAFDGTHFQVRDLIGVPEACQQPHPPFVLGGGGPRVLRIAGGEADIVTINATLRDGRMDASTITEVAPDKIRAKLTYVRQGAEAAGRRFEDLELAMPQWALRITATRTEGSAALDKLARASGVDAAVLAATPGVLIGTAEAVADKLRREREALGISYIHVDAGPRSTNDIMQFAPVIAMLAGT